LTIKNARKKADPERAQKRRRVDKRAYTQVDRVLVLDLLAEAEDEGQPLLVKEACERISESGCTLRTAESILSQLKQAELIDKVKKSKGREKQIFLTAKGSGFLAQKGIRRGTIFLPPIHPSENGRSLGRVLKRPYTQPEEVSEQQVERAAQGADRDEGRFELCTAETPPIEESSLPSFWASVPFDGEYDYARTRFIRHAGWDYPEGKLHLVLKQNWIDDWYRISFQGRRRTRLIQFTTDWEDLAERALFHDQLCVGGAPYVSDFDGDPELRLPQADGTPHVSTGMPVYRSFISQRTLDRGATDPIAELGWKTYSGKWVPFRPRPCTFGLAVELSKDGIPATRQVVDDDWNELTLPCYGLVVEPDWVDRSGRPTFWPSLCTFCLTEGLTA